MTHIENENSEQVWISPIKKDEVSSFVRFLQRAKEDIPVEDLGLTVRSYNCLRRAGCDLLSDCFAYYPDNFCSISHMGVKSGEEVKNVIDERIIAVLSRFKCYLSNNEVLPVEEEDTNNDSTNEDFVQMRPIVELLDVDATKKQIIAFYLRNNISISELRLSNRSYNCLMRANVKDLAALLMLFPDELLEIKNLGRTSYAELENVILKTLSKDERSIYSYLMGDIRSVTYSEEEIQSLVLNCYRGKGFAGLSFNDIRANIPKGIDDAQLKKTIGKLLQAKSLEYLDYRCYRIYPSFESSLEKYGPMLSEREYRILCESLKGHTLNEIGQGFQITRERVRQILLNAHKHLKSIYINDTGLDLFDEDYYRLLDETYNVSEECWFTYLALSETQLGYLKSSRTAKTRDKLPLADALTDARLDLGTRLKLNDYLNRDSIYLDGEYIKNSRQDLLSYYLRKYCVEVSTVEDFFAHYNGWLQDNGIAADSQLLFDTARNAEATLARIDNVIWSNRKTFRFYDFSSRDFDDLFDGLSLEAYHNIEISTQKLYNDHRELMAEYDILDRYELHNLLRRLNADKKYPELAFGKMPTITFGTFDRNEAIMEIISVFSPISRDELVNYLYDEYGYDKNTLILVYLAPFEKYYHHGVYIVDSASMIPDAQKELLSHLPDDFYYIDEIKKKYLELFPVASTDDINPRSLLLMGFHSHGTYAIRGSETSEGYFSTRLLRDDVFDMAPLKMRYGSLRPFDSAVTHLKQGFEIFEYAPNKFINVRKFAAFNIDKTDIKDYCYSVAETVEKNTFFTVHSLFNSGFKTDLSSFGFGELFFSSILVASGLFTVKKIFGAMIFYNGEMSNAKEFVPTFLLNAFNEYDTESVYLDDLTDDCCATYGLVAIERASAIEGLTLAGLYYNKYTFKVYRDKKTYLSEHEQ